MGVFWVFAVFSVFIILFSDPYLELNGFSKFSVLVLAGGNHFGDLLVESVPVDFRHVDLKQNVMVN